MTKSGMVSNYGQLSTIYAGNYIYDGFTDNETLKFFNHPEGYIQPTEDTNNPWDYVYQFKDHLGNIRLSYSDSDDNGTVDATEIIEENNYYPFGMSQKGYNNSVSAGSNSIASKFKYNGIELEESLGFNLYEMEFRQYDPAIARFTSIDPVTHHSKSTYNAFDNNPVIWADPSGADSESFFKSDFLNENGGHWTDQYKNGKNEKEENEENKNDNDSQLDKLVKEKGTSQVIDGVTYSYVGAAPEKFSLTESSNKAIINGLVEWAVYINSGNKVHLADMVIPDDTHTAKNYAEGFIKEPFPLYKNERIIKDGGLEAGVRFFKPYFFRGGADNSDFKITYVDLYDSRGQWDQISFLTTVKDSNQQPTVGYVRSLTRDPLQMNLTRKIRNFIIDETEKNKRKR